MATGTQPEVARLLDRDWSEASGTSVAQLARHTPNLEDEMKKPTKQLTPRRVVNADSLRSVRGGALTVHLRLKAGEYGPSEKE